MNLSVFKNYDIRGKYPQEVNEETAFWIGVSAKKIFNSSKPVLVGHDTRKSSPHLYRALVEGLKNSGFKKIITVGFATKPMVVFLTKKLEAGGGIIVTASHNPKEDGGFKLADDQGLVVGGKEVLKKIQKAKASFQNQNQKLFYSEKKSYSNISGKPTKFHHLYTSFLEKRIDTRKPLKIVVDCSNGTVGPIWQILKKRYQRKGIKVIIVNQKPDGNFPAHGPNPLLKGATRDAVKRVLKEKADIGVVFDGDGDRVVFVDNHGRTIIPTEIWRLFLAGEKNIKTVFSPVNEFDVEIIAPTLNHWRSFKNYISLVGPVSMEGNLKKRKADIGVESTGHYYFRGFFFADSGVLAAIWVINKLSLLPYSLSEFLDTLPHIEKLPEINIKYSSQKKGLQVLSKIKRHFQKKGAEMSFFDGISVSFGRGWFNLRKSNTENFLRLNLRAVDKKTLSSLKRQVLRLVRQ